MAASAGYSADGRCRCFFVADRCCLVASRRRSEPRVGLVGRRRGAPGARPSVMSSASFPRAISRLRSWDRCSEAVTVSIPVMSRCPSRLSSMVRSWSESTAEPAMFQESSTRVSVVLTCWPPGPDERENLQWSSEAGIVSVGDTSRSIKQVLHGWSDGFLGAVLVNQPCHMQRQISDLVVSQRFAEPEFKYRLELEGCGVGVRVGVLDGGA